MYQFLRPILFALPAELSHNLSLPALGLCQRLHLLEGIYGAMPLRPVEVMGLRFPNPVGLAAGLDKEGRYIDSLGALGFGFVEIGTLTPKPQPGNPCPRLFRLPKDKALLNRMGFNNAGVEAFLPYAAKRQYKGILGVNIGKNKNTPLELAVDDYLFAFKKVYPYADYVSVNLSSPNTPGLTALQSAQYLGPLLKSLKQAQAALSAEHSRYVPLVVKVSPDLDCEAVKAMADIFLEHAIDGLIATNTTIQRDGLATRGYENQAGGLSGAPLTERSTQVLAWFYERFGEKIPLIAVGGIMSAKDAQMKRDVGAKLVQIYTGLIYQGPSLIRDIIRNF